MSAGDAGKAVTYGCFGSFGIMLFCLFLLAGGVVCSIVLCAGGFFFTGKAVESIAETTKQLERDAAPLLENERRREAAQAEADRIAAAAVAREDAAKDALPAAQEPEQLVAPAEPVVNAEAVAAQSLAEKQRQERLAAQEREHDAVALLKAAEGLKSVNAKAYSRRLKEVAEKYPETVAGKKAADLMAK